MQIYPFSDQLHHPPTGKMHKAPNTDRAQPLATTEKPHETIGSHAELPLRNTSYRFLYVAHMFKLSQPRQGQVDLRPLMR